MSQTNGILSVVALRITISMRALLIALLLALSAAAQEKAEKAAQKSAEQWLALVDAANYDESWNQAAEVFKSKVTQDSWKQQVSAVRNQTGKLKSRKLKSAKFTDSLPGAPAGNYVILQFDSSFNAGPAIETVVLMEQNDNSWKVAGYFVKPA
jgi:hypothetical protein